MGWWHVSVWPNKQRGRRDDHIGQCIGWSDYCFDWWIAVNFCADVYVPWRMDPNYCGDLLAFLLIPPWCWHSCVKSLPTIWLTAMTFFSVPRRRVFMAAHFFEGKETPAGNLLKFIPKCSFNSTMSWMEFGIHSTIYTLIMIKYTKYHESGVKLHRKGLFIFICLFVTWMPMSWCLDNQLIFLEIKIEGKQMTTTGKKAQTGSNVWLHTLYKLFTCMKDKDWYDLEM